MAAASANVGTPLFVHTISYPRQNVVADECKNRAHARTIEYPEPNQQSGIFLSALESKRVSYPDAIDPDTAPGLQFLRLGARFSSLNETLATYILSRSRFAASSASSGPPSGGGASGFSFGFEPAGGDALSASFLGEGVIIVITFGERVPENLARWTTDSWTNLSCRRDVGGTGPSKFESPAQIIALDHCQPTIGKGCGQYAIWVMGNRVGNKWTFAPRKSSIHAASIGKFDPLREATPVPASHLLLVAQEQAPTL